MSIADQIIVNAHYRRSVNLARVRNLSTIVRVMRSCLAALT